MEPGRLALVAAAATLAGAVNSIAGGGSLISFPALVYAGVPPVLASATNTVALTPGGIAAAVAYRRELGARGRVAFALALPAAVGGVVGGALLLRSPPRVFELIVPWLVALATLLILLQRRLAPAEAKRPRRVGLAALGLAVMAVYGGFFGAGIGIVTLAVLGFVGEATIHEQNAMKSVIVASINAAASVYFLISHAALTAPALAMAAGAITGGYAGAAIARRVEPPRVRRAVIAIGVLMSILLGLRYYA